MIRRHLALALLVYVGVALIQIPATVGGLHGLTGLWWPLCVLFGLLFGSTPILGSLIGAHGAQVVWGWRAQTAYVLFVGLPVLSIALGALMAAFERLKYGPVPHPPAKSDPS